MRPPSAFATKKRSPSNVAVILRRRRSHLTSGLPVEVRLLVGEPPHLDAGDEQERAEEVEHPVELGDQPGAGEDHHRAHHDGAEHAVDQDALLQFDRNGEEREQHQPDEDVVDRQRLLDQVAGDELQRFLVGGLAAGGPVEIPPQRAGEKQRGADPDPPTRSRPPAPRRGASLPPPTTNMSTASMTTTMAKKPAHIHQVPIVSISPAASQGAARRSIGTGGILGSQVTSDKSNII